MLSGGYIAVLKVLSGIYKAHFTIKSCLLRLFLPLPLASMLILSLENRFDQCKESGESVVW